MKRGSVLILFLMALLLWSCEPFEGTDAGNPGDPTTPTESDSSEQLVDVNLETLPETICTLVVDCDSSLEESDIANCTQAVKATEDVSGLLGYQDTTLSIDELVQDEALFSTDAIESCNTGLSELDCSNNTVRSLLPVIDSFSGLSSLFNEVDECSSVADED